jgi:hypothetical protein
MHLRRTGNGVWEVGIVLTDFGNGDAKSNDYDSWYVSQRFQIGANEDILRCWGVKSSLKVIEKNGDV